jgi:hypothetical protein
VVSIVKDAIEIFKKKSRNGKRFGEIFTDDDFKQLTDQNKKENNRIG